MIDIYDEEGYIQEVLQNGFSQKWQRDAALLVKYFKTEYALGNQPSWNKAWVKETIKEKCKKYTHAAPFTKESLLYREIFEKYYPGQSQMIADFWMPNKSWRGCNVDDPSARVLSNYGESGK